MFQTSKQLKDQIRNLSRSKNIESHLLLRNYMMERFLERISLSSFHDNFILKGGILVAAMVGIESRSTMDMDTTLKDSPLTVESINRILEELLATQVNDNVQYKIKTIDNIMDEAEYPGIRVSLEAFFDGVRIPLKIDISTGDVVTPAAILFEIPLMFEDRKIPICAYNLETVLAEKMETIIVRSVSNTRMRDLYDIYILQKLYKEQLDFSIFAQALKATASFRGSTTLLNMIPEVIDEVEQSLKQQNLWLSYREKFAYAELVEWHEVISALRNLAQHTYS